MYISDNDSHFHDIVISLPSGRFESLEFTVTANVGDSVDLEVVIRGGIPPKLPDGINDIRWQKQGDTPSGFETFSDKHTTFQFDSVTVADGGVYATYWRGRRQNFQFGLIRLIVRSMLNQNHMITSKIM